MQGCAGFDAETGNFPAVSMIDRPGCGSYPCGLNPVGSDPFDDPLRLRIHTPQNMKALNRPVILFLAAHGTLFAQGPIEPAEAPAPTMKSLQEIWDKIGGLETQAAQLATQNAQLQKQLALLSAATVNFAWNFSTAASGANRRNISLAFGPDGQPAVAYQNVTNEDLGIARFDGSQWTQTIIESEGTVGEHACLAFDPAGFPAVSYYAAGPSFQLRIARYDGASWTVSDVVLAQVALPTSLAFGQDGQPSIAYFDSSTYDVKISRYDGTDWTTTLVDGAGTIVGTGGVSMAFAPDGQPAISYTDENAKLKIARLNGATWVKTLVDGGTNTGLSPSLLFGPDGHPSIGYFSLATLNVHFARFTGGSWALSTVDTSASNGGHTSLAFGPDGQPSISYYSSASADLRFARFNGTGWVVATVDSAGAVGQYSSLKYAPDGQPAIAYMDYTNYLVKLARKGAFAAVP